MLQKRIMNLKMDKNGVDDNTTEVGKLKDNIKNNSEPTILGSPRKFHEPVITVQPPKSSSEIPQCCQKRTSDMIDSIGMGIPLSHNSRSDSVTDMSSSNRGYSSSPSSPSSLIKHPQHYCRRLADSIDTVLLRLPEQPEEPNDEPVSLPTVEAWMPVDRDSEEYNMNHPRRGRAVIFNNEEFDTKNIEKRDGSSTDVKNLEETFTDLDFDVTTHHNKSYYEIIDIIDSLAKEDHTNADCMAIIVLSHGRSEGAICARDTLYNVENLWTPFTGDKCPTLAGKPKLFFIQACRGYGLDPGVNLSRKSQTETYSGPESHGIPTHTDLPLAFRSVGGSVLDGNALPENNNEPSPGEVEREKHSTLDVNVNSDKTEHENSIGKQTGEPTTSFNEEQPCQEGSDDWKISDISKNIPLNQGVDAGVNLSRRKSQAEKDSGLESYKIPTQADILLAFSTFEGFYSFRHPESGTWFIECLCEELKKNAHKYDLLKLLTRIARRVALDYESDNDIFLWQHQKKQMPTITSTLIREVHFRPKDSMLNNEVSFHPKKWYSRFLDFIYGVATHTCFSSKCQQ